MRQLNTSFWGSMQPVADAISQTAAKAMCVDFFEDLSEASCVQNAEL
jgi:hypothetical protein